jgi:rubrerythrin
MEKFDSINAILDFAINGEQEAVEFYSKLSENAANKEMKDIFDQFSREEMGHKSKLIKIKENGLFTLQPAVILDLKIADYVVNVIPGPDMTYQDALVVAMQKEKAAFKLYQKLASQAPNEDIKSIFISLSQEEAKHKLRFEVEYDEFVLKEN